MLHLIELDAVLGILMIIVYALYGLKQKETGQGNYVHFYLHDVIFFTSLFALVFVFGYYMEAGIAVNSVVDSTYGSLVANVTNFVGSHSLDVLLAVLLFGVIPSFASFESVLLLLFAFIGSYFMMHSVDLLTFFISLEAQNFCFLVLCGLGTSNLRGQTYVPAKNQKGHVKGSAMDSSSFSVEVTLKYFLLSAFSSGVILFWLSMIYLETGMTSLNFSSALQLGALSPDASNTYAVLILFAMMFKLGAAPLHLWVMQIYGSVKRSLLMYISTVPKVALFGFWLHSFHSVWTDYSVAFFALFSIVLGSLGAYNQPALRSLFAYSTVNEIGLMLMAVETAGFHSLMQHLTIYVVSQFLLWNTYDKRFFSVLAVSLAGLPPFAGFFGKAWIFWHVSSLNLYGVLILALLCTGISLVYYLRILRLFWRSSLNVNTRVINYDALTASYHAGLRSHVNFVSYETRTVLTSLCAVLLVVLPLFVIKPFVL